MREYTDVGVIRHGVFQFFLDLGIFCCRRISKYKVMIKNLFRVQKHCGSFIFLKVALDAWIRAQPILQFQGNELRTLKTAVLRITQALPGLGII